MRRVLTTISEVAGMALITAGLAWIWLPLGVIALGAALVVLGVVSA